MLFVLDLGHSNRCVESGSHHYFDWHFPDDIQCGTSFYMFIFLLYIFGKVAAKVLGSFSNRLFVCFLTGEM